MERSESDSLLDWFLEQPSTLRWCLGLLGCAVVAIYVPLILVATTGTWVENLTRVSENLACAAILMLQGATGIFLKRQVVVSGFFAFLWLVFFSWAVASTERIEHWRLWWVVLFIPPVSSLLNGFLLNRFERWLRRDTYCREPTG
jgi:hypothetical protein